MPEATTREIISETSTAAPQCSICMADFEPGDAKVHLGCSHTFHYSCILTWNLSSPDQNHRSCPLCRDNMEVDEILDRRPMPRQPIETTFSQSPLGRRPLAEVVNDNQGLELTCTDCHCEFNYCEMCGIFVCECEYQPHSQNWRGRRYHSCANPFGTPIDSEELEEGELPMIHCSNCFENREELVLDFMMDDHGDIDIFYHERIQELYEEFFLDTSGKDHTQLHQTYPSYTFDEFRDYMTERFQQELQNDFIMDEPMDELNEIDEETDISLNSPIQTSSPPPPPESPPPPPPYPPPPVSILNSDIVSITPVSFNVADPQEIIRNTSHLVNISNPIEFDETHDIIETIINYIQNDANQNNGREFQSIRTEINSILNDTIIIPEEAGNGQIIDNELNQM